MLCLIWYYFTLIVAYSFCFVQLNKPFIQLALFTMIRFTAFRLLPPSRKKGKKPLPPIEMHWIIFYEAKCCLFPKGKVILFSFPPSPSFILDNGVSLFTIPFRNWLKFICESVPRTERNAALPSSEAGRGLHHVTRKRHENVT